MSCRRRSAHAKFTKMMIAYGKATAGGAAGVYEGQLDHEQIVAMKSMCRLSVVQLTNIAFDNSQRLLDIYMHRMNRLKESENNLWHIFNMMLPVPELPQWIKEGKTAREALSGPFDSDFERHLGCNRAHLRAVPKVVYDILDYSTYQDPEMYVKINSILRGETGSDW